MPDANPRRLSVDSTPDDVHAFWFGEGDLSSVAFLKAGWERWFFGRDLLFDIEQRSAGPLIARVAEGDLLSSAWATPRGELAKLLILDQFTRCAYRGTAQAVAHDALACACARRLVTSGGFDRLLPIERFFVCVALSHAEDRADSQLHVELAAWLTDGLPASTPTEVATRDAVRAYFDSLRGFPHEHFETIQRFGRFPHRNALLGRSSTAEEVAWLASPDCPGWACSQRRAILSYWDGRGLGDPVRFLLEFCLIPFDEDTVRSREGFEALKASGKLAFDQVPLLEIDGLQLVQTQAILRYVAGSKGLRGYTPADQGVADMVVNGILDARMPLITARFGADPQAALSKFESVTLPRLVRNVERILLAHDGGYICRGGLSYADVRISWFEPRRSYPISS